jgi:hypothetical protein
MTTLTGQNIANTYKQLLQVGSNNAGLTASVQTIQDGSGTNSALQLSQSAVNINGTFQLNGTTLTATASALNAVPNITSYTGFIAVSGTSINGRTLVAGTGVSISNANGTEGNPNISLNTTGVVSGSYGPFTKFDVNSVGQIVSATAVSTSVSVPTIRASEFIGGTFKGTTAEFSSNTSIGGTAIVEGAARFKSTVSVSGALNGSTAAFTGTVSAGNISGANATFSGNISATEYYGDGSNLTGIVAASATYAASAGFAASATNASFALSATNANFAASASYAASTSYAASAGEASFAVSASTAAFATSADSATFAVSAANATTAYNVSGGNATLDYLFATSASISDFRATHIYGTSVSIDYLNASDITAITISATDLKSSTLSFTSVSVSSLRVYRLAVETTLSATYGTFTGNVSAVSFYGDGSNLTDLPTAPTSVSAYTVNQLSIVSAATLAGVDLETRINTVSVNTSVNSAAITSINAVVDNLDFATSAELATVSAYATSIVQALSATMATSIDNSNTNITTNANAITSINIVVANVSALTSVNAAAITSINAVIEGNVSADSGTFNTLTVVTSASIGGTLNVGGNVGIGTTAPGGNLHVQGEAGNQVRLYLTDGDATGTGNSLLISKSGTASFISDRQASSQLWFGTADTERMRIDSSGNVAVGTTTADAAVTVYKSADSLDGVSIRQNSAGSSAGARLKFGNNSDTRDAEIVLTGSGNSSYAGARTLNFVSNIGGFGFYRSYTTPVATMVLDSSGNVGIGTSSPGTPLHVEGAAAANNLAIRVINTDTSGYSTIQLGGADAGIYRNGSAQTGYGGASSLNLITVGAHPIAFSTGNTPRVIINSSGRVGIGTSSPAAALTVSDGTVSSLTPFGGTELFLDSIGSNYLQFGSGTSSSPAIYFGDSADGDVGGIIYAHASNAMSFRTNAAERMRIDTSGNVLIGTTTIPAGQKMVVLGGGVQFSGGTSAQEGLRIQRDSGFARISGINNDNNTFNAISFFTSGTAALHITTGNNVGIGTSSPSRKLEVLKSGVDDVNVAVIGGGSGAGGASVAIGASGTSSYIRGVNNGVSGYTPLNVGGSVTVLETNGSEKVRIDSSGNVGIGNAAPSYLLDLYKAASTVVRVRNSAATGGTPSTTHGEFVIESTDGNMGMQFLGSTTADQRILFSDTAAASGQIVYNHTSNYMALFTNTAERMRITSSGNVGIGTTSAPSAKLNIQNPLAAGASTNYALRINDSTTNTAGGTNLIGWSHNSNDLTDINVRAALGVTIDGGGAGNLVFRTGGYSSQAERVRIDSSGNVGIGTASPENPMTIQDIAGSTFNRDFSIRNGDATNYHRLTLGYNAGSLASGVPANAQFLLAEKGGGYGTSGGLVLGNSDNAPVIFTTNATERMRIDSSGNVGVGTSSPAKQFEITKASRALIGTLTDGATITPDFDANQNFTVTLGGNRTLANPTNVDAGQTGSIFVVQDATGGRTLSFGANWKFAGGTAPTLSTGANAVDRIDYIVKSSTEIHAVATLNLS